MARAITAQMAHETGWGRSTAGGNNMAGIKADASWGGPVVNAQTEEVFGGQSQRLSQPFRAYASWQDSVADYVDFIARQPRYQRAGLFQAKTPAEYFAALQSAGYATDPAYATKLSAVYDRISQQ